MTSAAVTSPLVVANCSGFYGDRLSAMREALDGGPVDVITGDYLAELTMLILGRQRMKDPAGGWTRTFQAQLEDTLGTALERGVRIVSNAGGLNPTGLADAVRQLADGLGLDVKVATVAGDDLVGRLDQLDVRHGDVPPGDAPVSGALTANAHLGCWGIVRALQAGADVVVTGRVTDASLVVGPAAWHHGWSPADLDALAGATVAGHVLECGTQASGGNFSFFTELLDADAAALDAVGFPIAEVAADGSSVVTKHPGTGGAVTVETVTEQLLYECTGAQYGGPDVVTRFDTIALEQEGPDRVRVNGVRGLEEASALLHVTVKDGDRDKVAKAFTAPLIELALASIPGFFTTTAPPSPSPSPSPYGVFSPAWVRAELVSQQVTLPDGTVEQVSSVGPDGGDAAPATTASADPAPPAPAAATRAAAPPSACTRAATRATGGWRPFSLSSGCRRCCPRPPGCRSPGSRCRICALCCSSCPVCSAKRSPRAPASTRRPRGWVSGCGRAWSTSPRHC